MPDPQPAATVMIVRDAFAGLETLLLRRSTRSAFMPDVFVFPGGRVDAGDASSHARAFLGGAPERAEPAHVFAAARETFEEAGLLLCSTPVDIALIDGARRRLLDGRSTFTDVLHDLDTVVDATTLHYFSRWITPATEPRRFDTHFFVARAPAGQIASADCFETHDGRWIAPSAALEQSVAGTLALMFPTIKHLERLRAFATVDAVLAYARTKPIAAVVPIAAAAGTFVVPRELENRW